MVHFAACLRDAETATERVTSEKEALENQVATVTSKLEAVEQERERQAKLCVVYIYLPPSR